MNKKVSIVVPIYNVQEYLAKCVESIRKQTYTELEIILVDDGSKDECPRMCDEYKELDSRIKVIHKPNGGLSDARNAGLEQATGEYIYFLDSDDYIEENLIERALTAMEHENADMVVFNYDRINEEGKTWRSDYLPSAVYEIDGEKERLQFYLNKFFKYVCGFEAWNRLYSAKVIHEHQLRFYENKKIFSEDICFNLCYFLYAKKIVVIEDVLYHYLIRANSIMGQNKAYHINEYIRLGEYVYGKTKAEIKDNYYMIFMLLMEKQFGRMEVAQIPTKLQEMTEQEFYWNMNKEICAHPIAIIRNIGFGRGMKYYLFNLYYKNNSLILKNMLSFIERNKRRG